jgi:hypothetical protein
VTPAAEEPLDAAIELAFWEGVRDAQDPALLGAFSTNIRDGQFAPIAQARLEGVARSATERPTNGGD